MQAPPGIDSESSDEDISPLTSPEISPIKPKFSFRNVFAHTPRPSPTRKPDVNSTPLTSPTQDTPVKKDKDSPLTELKKRVRILTQTDARPTTNTDEPIPDAEPVDDLPSPELPPARGGVGRQGGEEGAEAAEEMLALLRSLVTQTRARDEPSSTPSTPIESSAPDPAPSKKPSRPVTSPLQTSLPVASPTPADAPLQPSTASISPPSVQSPPSQTGPPHTHAVQNPHGLNYTFLHPHASPHTAHPYPPTHQAWHREYGPSQGLQASSHAIPPSQPGYNQYFHPQQWSSPYYPSYAPYHPPQPAPYHPPPMYPHPASLQPWHPSGSPNYPPNSWAQAGNAYQTTHLAGSISHGPHYGQAPQWYSPWMTPSHSSSGESAPHSPETMQNPWSPQGLPASTSAPQQAMQPPRSGRAGTRDGLSDEARGKTVHEKKGMSVSEAPPRSATPPSRVDIATGDRNRVDRNMVPEDDDPKRSQSASKKQVSEAIKTASDKNPGVSRERRSERSRLEANQPSRPGEPGDPVSDKAKAEAGERRPSKAGASALNSRRDRIMGREAKHADDTESALAAHLQLAGGAEVAKPSTKHSEQITWSKGLLSLATCIDIFHGLLQTLQSRKPEASEKALLSRMIIGIAKNLSSGRGMQETLAGMGADETASKHFGDHLKQISRFIMQADVGDTKGDGKTQKIMAFLLSNERVVELLSSFSLGRYLTPGVLMVVKDLATRWLHDELDLKSVLKGVMMLRKEVHKVQDGQAGGPELLDELAVVFSKQIKRDSTAPPAALPVSTTPTSKPPQLRVRPRADSSDSAYSTSPDSPGTLESDEEASRMLAEADSGPSVRSTSPRLHGNERHQRPRADLVQAAREVLIQER